MKLILLFIISMGMLTLASDRRDDISPLKTEIYQKINALKGTVPQEKVLPLRYFVQKKIEENDSSRKDSSMVYSEFN